MIRNLLPFLFSLFFLQLVDAQGIHGRITNMQGEAIPFATIYIPDMSTGTTSNSEGNYELKLPEGKRKVLFQCLGYQTQTVEPIIGKSFQEINIRLDNQDYQIPEIKVMASGEDPAYYIMRRAIASSAYYKKQVSKYSCKVYLKGSGLVEKIPGILKKQMKEEGIELNKPFVMETVSKIDFELPDKLKQQVLAMRSSGKDFNTSPMPLISGGNVLYVSNKSPVSVDGLRLYRFRLDGVFNDQGRTINKIQVIPKTEDKELYSGYIYIADSYYYIHSADLYMHPAYGDVHLHLLTAEVNKNAFMPVSYDFDVSVALLGVKANFRYVASINEYSTTLNPALDHSFLDHIKDQQLKEQQAVQKFLANEKKEQEKTEKSKGQARIDALVQKQKLTNREAVKLNRLVESEAQRNSPPEPLEIKSSFIVSPKQEKNDSAYWNSLRPIPLTDSEKKSFASKDSFLLKAADPAFKDSVNNAKRRFKLGHVFMGKTYDYSIDSIKKLENLSIPGILNPGSLSFNSVDGLRAELPFTYFRSDSTGHLLRLEPRLAYAFARDKLDASFRIARRWNGMTNSWISVFAGTTTEDFNRTSGLSAITNDFYTLWFEENYKRFYRRDFIQLNASRDLANGLSLNATLDYSDNRALSNHSNYSFIDRKDKVIQPNIPINGSLEPWQLENHQTFAYQTVLEYTPQYRYRVQNQTKVYAESKFPTFSLAYKSALSGILGSDARYDLVKLGIRQNIDFGIDDHFSYTASAGKFLNRNRVHFDEFQHFNTQPTGFMFSAVENSFRLLPFYQYSTSDQYLEGHANFQTRRLILKQLPLIRNSMISEKLFVNYLSTPGLKNYVETGYGISNLLLLMNVEAVAGFENGKFRSAGVKVSLNLN